MILWALKATGIWVAADLLLCMILGAVISGGLLEPDGAKQAAIICGELMVFLCCLLAAKKCGRKRLPVALLTVGLIVVIRIAAGYLFFSQEIWSNGWRFLLPALAALAAGVIAGMKRERRR